MNAAKIAGILLMVAGVLALVYGGFTYTDVHKADLGPVQMTVKEKDHVNVPVWAGVGALVVGGLLLGFGRKA